MKKLILGLVLMTAITAMSFAGDILPELNEYAASILPGDAILVSMFPNTPQTEEKLLRLRNGDHNLIVTERVVGPSKKPISTATIDAHKMHGMAALAAKMNSYVRGEAYTIVYNEEDASRMATEISSTIVYAETLRNSKEELRLTYTFKNSDGSTGYGVSIWLAAEKAPLDEAIKEIAGEASNPAPAKQRTAEVQTSSVPETSGADLVKSVQSLMVSNERIMRFREENKQLLGIDE